jgi:putative photosynthetic complex assembly protein
MTTDRNDTPERKVPVALRDPGLSRRMVMGAGLLCASTFVWAFVTRRQNLAAREAHQKSIHQQRAFIVEGSTPGPLVLRDVDTNKVIKAYTSEQEGFVRMTLKGLERSRKSAEVDLRAPYQLTRYRDGTLVLEDIGTNQRIELIAFGSTNIAAFAELLTAERSTP